VPIIFILYFAADGIIYPFWQVYLKYLGFNNNEIGLFIASAYWPQVFIGFVIAYLADWRFSQLRLAGGIALMAMLCICLFYLPQSVILFVVLGAFYGGLWSAVLPLTEANLLALDRSDKQDYGRIRAMGSLAFIIVSISGGSLINFYGQQIIPGLVASLMLLTAAACFWLAAATSTVAAASVVTPRTRPDWKKVINLKLLMVLGSAGFIQMSHSLYFATASNMWADFGYTSTAIGVFWAIAVVAEICYFSFSSSILRYQSPFIMIALSGICAAARWALFALNDGLSGIIVGQVLHALSFAAYHSAVMRFIRDNAPEGVRTLTQAVYYSLMVALPMGIALPIAGLLFDVYSTTAYGYMAMIALAGSLISYAARKL